MSEFVLYGGGGAVVRFDGARLTLRRSDKEHDIPLAAVQLVHAEGRTISVALTASDAVEPTVYRVTDVSEDEATAFADAVNGALPTADPSAPAVDGAELVTTRTPQPAASPKGWRKLLAALLKG